MNLCEYLEQKGVQHKDLKHTPTFTAQELAAAEHVSGNTVAKMVVIKAGDNFRLLVLPASYNVRFDLLEKYFGRDCRLATEQEISEVFPDCELGAMPPFGHEYGIETVADSHLLDDEEIVFQAGYHDQAIRMNWTDFERLEQPRIVNFAEHLH